MSFPHHLIPEEIKSTWKEMELNPGLRAPEMNSLTSRLWLLGHNYERVLLYKTFSNSNYCFLFHSPKDVRSIYGEANKRAAQ